MYPLFLAQRKQRFTAREGNFGFFNALTFVDVFAIYLFYFLENGMPNDLYNSIAFS